MYLIARAFVNRFGDKYGIALVVALLVILISILVLLFTKRQLVMKEKVVGIAGKVVVKKASSNLA